MTVIYSSCRRFSVGKSIGSRPGALSTLREVAANWQTAGIKPVIIDAGANVGYSALYFASLFPGVCVLAVEPDRTSFEILARHARANQQSGPYMPPSGHMIAGLN